MTLILVALQKTPETVTDLGLPIRRLREPLTVTLALNNDPDELTELWDYVSLSLSSLNNAWSSKPVRALIAPGLCSNILLGLPFLVHNKIVIDHDSRTAIDKTCGFETPKGDRQLLIICGILNLFLFGIGTLIAGIQQNSTTDIIIGLLQFFLPFIGWLWSIIWGVLMIKRSDYISI